MAVRGLSASEIERFVAEGFVPVRGAFPRAVADEGRSLLWEMARTAHPGLDQHDPATWTAPVLRLAGSGAPPFRAAADSAVLARACDQVVGEGRWRPLTGLGRFPIRFPTPGFPEDSGWHLDASIPVDDTWHANITSDRRALLMLFLFSDVAEIDGPTRIRVGSHLPVARALAPLGPEGMHHGAVRTHVPELDALEVALATGNAGDVYLCHPFLVHAASQNRSGSPRFLANPALPATGPLRYDRPDGDHSPVERAVRIALGLAG